MPRLTEASIARLRESVRVTENMQQDVRRTKRRQIPIATPSWLGWTVPGEIVGESEPVGWAYWVVAVYIESGQGDLPFAVPFNQNSAAYRYEKVYNTAESCTGGHLLATGTIVDVRATPANATSGKLTYWMHSPPSPAFSWAKITASLSYGANKWQYTGELTTNGTSPYVPARTLTNIYNSTEDWNIADPSIRGNSVDSGGAAYPVGFSLQPIRGTPIVQVHPVVSSACNGVASWWYTTYENADDGTCT